MAERSGRWTARRRTRAWLGLGLGMPLTLIGVLGVAVTGQMLWAWLMVAIGVLLLLVGLFVIPKDGRRDSGGGVVTGGESRGRKDGEGGGSDFGGGCGHGGGG